MARPYNKLRALMVANDYDQPTLARKLRKSARYVNERINAHSSWELDDAYQILSLFGEPASALYTYFPPGGRNEQCA